MSDPFGDRPFPRAPLLGAAGLILLALVLAAGGRLVGTGEAAIGERASIVRDLRFADRSDGGIDVIDAALDRPLDVVMPGSNGFLRATLRGLARERKRHEGGPEIPFRLTAWQRPLTRRPATGRTVDGLGATNAEVFGRLPRRAGAVMSPPAAP
jgi:putative photosynthetic complex assembly protein